MVALGINAVPRCNGQRQTYYQQTAQNYFATDIKKRKKVRGFDGVLRGRSYVELLVLISEREPVRSVMSYDVSNVL